VCTCVDLQHYVLHYDLALLPWGTNLLWSIAMRKQSRNTDAYFCHWNSIPLRPFRNELLIFQASVRATHASYLATFGSMTLICLDGKSKALSWIQSNNKLITLLSKFNYIYNFIKSCSNEALLLGNLFIILDRDSIEKKLWNRSQYQVREWTVNVALQPSRPTPKRFNSITIVYCVYTARDTIFKPETRKWRSSPL
jgi:hypothetical protein